MTNPSKQICEICGIEPVLRNCEKAYENIGVYFCRELKMCEVLECGGYAVPCRTCEFAIETFPDFHTSANNFVRLYELKLKGYEDFITLGLEVSTSEAFSNRDDFLTRLHNLIEPDSKWEPKDHKLIKAIKQAIRAEQWEV